MKEELLEKMFKNLTEWEKIEVEKYLEELQRDQYELGYDAGYDRGYSDGEDDTKWECEDDNANAYDEGFQDGLEECKESK